MTQTETDMAVRSAWSIESRDAWESFGPVNWIFSTVRGCRIYDLYLDPAGGWWYRVRFIHGDEVWTDKQHVFGKKRKRKWNRYFQTRDENYHPRR